jgi:hypothetical protein
MMSVSQSSRLTSRPSRYPARLSVAQQATMSRRPAPRPPQLSGHRTVVSELALFHSGNGRNTGWSPHQAANTNKPEPYSLMTAPASVRSFPSGKA